MEKPNTIPWPPLVLLACIVCGFALNAFLPIGWPPSPISDFLFALGVLVLLTAIYLYYATFKIFRENGTTLSPVQAATTLVTTGPFALSRNPIYLANVLVTIALACLFGILWLIALAILMAVLLNRLAILPEEKHLEHKFGKQWRSYRKKVRRWI